MLNIFLQTVLLKRHENCSKYKTFWYCVRTLYNKLHFETEQNISSNIISSFTLINRTTHQSINVFLCFKAPNNGVIFIVKSLCR